MKLERSEREKVYNISFGSLDNLLSQILSYYYYNNVKKAKFCAETSSFFECKYFVCLLHSFGDALIHAQNHLKVFFL